jgi:DNA invertase Pin-like site-specific DNA recombinase
MKKNEKIGFARVSTTGQAQKGLQSQIEFLKEQGCDEIYTEVVSGRTTRNKRPELQEMLDNLLPNQVVVTKAIDRIARNLRELTNIIAEIHNKQCFIQIVEQNINTSRKDGVSELLIGILGSISSWELQMQRNRRNVGIKRCLQEGRAYGRPKKISEAQEKMLIEGYRSGMSYKQLSESFGISRQSVWNRVKTLKTAPCPV